MNETKTQVSEVRQLRKCSRCKSVVSRLVSRTTDFVKASPDKFGYAPWKVTHTIDRLGAERVEPMGACCNRESPWVDVRGKFSDKHECGAKCRSSKGPTCECSCSGKNHGSNWSSQ